MASVLSRLRSRNIERAPSQFQHQGQPYPFEIYPPTGTLPGSPVEASAESFEHMVNTIGRRSSVVGAAVTQRSLAMSQLSFTFRSRRDQSRLFGTQALSVLERPSPDMTREDLLLKVEPDIAYAGNFYLRRLQDGRLRRLRPDWVSLLVYSEERPDPEEAHLAADAQLLGYVYKPGGRHSKYRAQVLTPAEVAHFAPEPHPLANFIGEAWVSAVVREIAADMQATDHVSKYFENAATANMVATAPPGVTSQEAFDAWVDTFDGAHRGARNAWRNIYVQAGTDVKVIGSQLGDLAMADLQGGFETRVSAKSRVPATVLLIREGLSGSALNAGNYAQTRRMWADSWFTPYAQAFCASMSRIIDVPADAELTYDPRRVLMLQEDQSEAADIRSRDAQTMRTLVDAGWDPDAALEFVRNNGDHAALSGKHSGLPSVQLQQMTAAERRQLALGTAPSGGSA